MHFHLLNSLRKLELANYSFVLSSQALLFALIVLRLSYKMTLQRSLSPYLQTKNANHFCSFVRDIQISGNIQTKLFENGKEIDFDDSPTIETEVFLSLKFGVLFLNPYQDERYFGKDFLKSFSSENPGTDEEFTGDKTLTGEKITSKQIDLKLQADSQSHLKTSLCLIGEFSKDGFYRNRSWAAWEKSESKISYQLNHPSDISLGFPELLIFAEKFCAKMDSVPMKTVVTDNGFIRGNKDSTFTRNTTLKVNKTSTFESTENYATSEEEKYTLDSFKCAALVPQSSISHVYNIWKNMKQALAEVLMNPISLDAPEHRPRGEFETLKFRKVLGQSRNGKKSRNMETENLKFGKNIKNSILSITRDDSNSDLQNLQEDVNQHFTAINLFPSFENFHYATGGDYNRAYSSDYLMLRTPRNESSTDFKFADEKYEKPDTSKGHFPVASGICLDSNFEETSGKSQAQEQESDFFGDARLPNRKTYVSEEFIYGLNSSTPLFVEDCQRVCLLCKKLVLNKFFLSNRFGILLNCFHSFCYSCIRNHSKSKRLSTSAVYCPKCGNFSPGIVSSPRWIRDTHEKTSLFQKYEKESKFFHKQQQVFFSFLL